MVPPLFYAIHFSRYLRRNPRETVFCQWITIFTLLSSVAAKSSHRIMTLKETIHHFTIDHDRTRAWSLNIAAHCGSNKYARLILEPDSHLYVFSGHKYSIAPLHRFRGIILRQELQPLENGETFSSSLSNSLFLEKPNGCSKNRSPSWDVCGQTDGRP